MQVLSGPATTLWSRIAKQICARYSFDLVAGVNKDYHGDILLPAEYLTSTLNRSLGTVFVFISTKHQIDSVVKYNSDLKIVPIYHAGIVPTDLLQKGYSVNLNTIRDFDQVFVKVQNIPIQKQPPGKLELRHIEVKDTPPCGKIAFLILAHKDTPQLRWMCENLNTENSYAFVHFDAKYEVPSYIKNLVPYRHQIEWGSPSLVTATLNSIQYIDATVPYDRLFLLSGEDLINSTIDEILSTPIDDVNMECLVVKNKSDVTQHGRSAKVYKRYFIDGHPFNSIECGFGSQWFSLSNRAVKYLLHHPDTTKLFDFYKNCRFADESFFQTFFLNSPFKINRQFHYIKWSGNKHPDCLDTVEIPKEFLFARKVCEKLPAFNNKCIEHATSFQVPATGIFIGESTSGNFKLLTPSFKKHTDVVSIFFIKSWAQLDLVTSAISGVNGDCIVTVFSNEPPPKYFPNALFIQYTSSSFAGKIFGLNLGTYIAAGLGYKRAYISMCDVVLREGAFNALLKSKSQFIVPTFYTKDVYNLDGQWPGMASQKVAHFEFLSWFTTNDVFSRFHPTDCFPTSWATGVHYSMLLTKYGIDIWKDSSIVADHKGGTTFGVKTVESQFKTREQYQEAGATESLLLLKTFYNNEFLNLLKNIDSTVKDKSFSIETRVALWRWYHYQFTHLSKKINILPQGNLPCVLFLFNSLHQGGVEKVFATVGHSLQESGITPVFCYWDTNKPHVDFDDLLTVNVTGGSLLHQHLSVVCKLLNPTAIITGSLPNHLPKFLKTQTCKKFAYLWDEDEFKNLTQDIVPIFESEILRKKYVGRSLFLPQPISMATLNSARTGKIILNVSRMHPYKNPELFGEIASLMPEYSFVWVGGASPDNKDYEDKLKKKYKDVTWLGDCDRNKVNEMLSEALIFVSTSRKEGISNAMLESLSFGVPIVCTDTLSSRELIDPTNGIVVHDLSTENYIISIKKIIAENKTREQVKRTIMYRNSFDEYAKGLDSILNLMNKKT